MSNAVIAERLEAMLAARIGASTGREVTVGCGTPVVLRPPAGVIPCRAHDDRGTHDVIATLNEDSRSTRWQLVESPLGGGAESADPAVAEARRAADAAWALAEH